jgi:integrase
MAALRRRIGLKDIRALGPGEIIWDGAVGGFHARRQQSKTVSYIVAYRTLEGRQRWQTIGRHGSPWTPETAREAAKRILGHVVEGIDPAAEKRAKRKAASVAELCDLYIADAEAGRLLTRRKMAKKASTIATDKGRIERHIKPLLGSMKVAAVTREDVDDFMHSVAEGRTVARIKTGKKRGLANVRGGKGTASRTVGLLGAIFSYALRHRMRPDNPVRGVTRFADGRRERRLSDAEYKMLGAVLKKAASEQVWPAAVAATRFLALTGWRSGEALGLRWDEIDLPRRTAILGDTKTGRSMRPLSRASCDLLKKMPRSGPLVFPATRGDGPMRGFRKLWNRILKFGELAADVTPNVLRHSFTSLGADLGYSDITIGAIVGHKGRTITSRYIHSADAVLLSVADAIADQTVALMSGSKRAVEIVPFRREFA